MQWKFAGTLYCNALYRFTLISFLWNLSADKKFEFAVMSVALFFSCVIHMKE